VVLGLFYWSMEQLKEEIIWKWTRSVNMPCKLPIDPTPNKILLISIYNHDQQFYSHIMTTWLNRGVKHRDMKNWQWMDSYLETFTSWIIIGLQTPVSGLRFVVRCSQPQLFDLTRLCKQSLFGADASYLHTMLVVLWVSNATIIIWKSIRFHQCVV
jgi:hypothetical protein